MADLTDLDRYLRDHDLTHSELASIAGVSRGLVCNAAQGLPIGDGELARRVSAATGGEVSLESLTRYHDPGSTPLGRYLVETSTTPEDLASRTSPRVAVDTVRKVARGMRLRRSRQARAIFEACERRVPLDAILAGGA